MCQLSPKREGVNCSHLPVISLSWRNIIPFGNKLCPLLSDIMPFPDEISPFFGNKLLHFRPEISPIKDDSKE